MLMVCSSGGRSAAGPAGKVRTQAAVVALQLRRLRRPGDQPGSGPASFHSPQGRLSQERSVTSSVVPVCSCSRHMGKVILRGFWRAGWGQR